MYQISRKIEIDAGHRIPFHDSKCRNLHGHRYVITVYASTDQLIPEEEKVSSSGMVLDFGVLKRVLMEQIHNVYDHRMILWEDDPILTDSFRRLINNLCSPDGGIRTIPVVPTAERLAEYWYDKLVTALPPNIDLMIVEVQETPNCVASYYPLLP